MELVTHNDVATAEETVELTELYARRAQETDDDSFRDRIPNRVNELVTIGLGRIDEEGGDEILRVRLEEAAFAAYKAAGVDGGRMR